MQFSFLSFPRTFASDSQKISYIIGVLCGRALRWAEAFFDESSKEDASLKDFLDLFNLTFSPTENAEESARKLWTVK